MEAEFEKLAEKEILSPEQAAAYLGIGRSKMFELLAKRTIPSFTVGRLRRVRRADVDRYVEGRLRSADF